MPLLRVALASLLLAACAGAVPSGGQALWKIAFYSPRAGNDHIYVVDSDGGNLRCLTEEFGGGICPCFSPDGREILFMAGREHNEDLYVMNSDGTNVRRLTSSPSTERHPAWSPDGTRIAFQSDRDGNREVYVMDADGSNWVRVTHDPASDMRPSWSPDGRQLAFNSERDGNWEIYIVGVDGRGLRRLTDTPAWELFPAWSPDGSRIAYRSGPAGVFQGDIHTIGPDGSGERTLTDADGVEEDPAWSPDGSHIVFQSMRDGDFEIYVIDRDGGAWENVTRNPAHDYWPTCAPVAGVAPSGWQVGNAVPPQDVAVQVVYDDSVRIDGLEAAAGFSCLVKVGDASILFDTGGNGVTLLSNMEKLGIDPAGVDYVVLSHLHSDHVCGLPALLGECDDPIVFAPATLPDNLSTRAEGLVAGAIASARERAAAVIEVTEPVQICEGVYSTGQIGTRIPEQALVIHTRAGLVVLTGCAHPGVVRLATAAKELLGENILLLIGGLHMEGRSPADVRAVVSELSGLSRWAAPCHCSGDAARALCRAEFGDRYIDVGAGSMLQLDQLVGD